MTLETGAGVTLEGQSRAAWHAGMRAVAHHARPTPADHRSLLRAPSPMCQLFQNEGLEDRSVLALSVSVFTLALHRSSYIFIFIYIKYLSVDRPPAFNVHDALWDFSALGTRDSGESENVERSSRVDCAHCDCAVGSLDDDVACGPSCSASLFGLGCLCLSSSIRPWIEEKSTQPKPQAQTSSDRVSARASDT